MADGSSYFQRLTAVRRMFQRRAKKKMSRLNCVSAEKTRTEAYSPTLRVSDVETQTTPTLQKSVCYELIRGAGNPLLMPAESCVVDSSRDSLDSEIYEGSSESLHHLRNCERYTDSMQPQLIVSCSCVDQVSHDQILCKCPIHGDAILEKLLDLQQEIFIIRDALRSLTNCGDERPYSKALQMASAPLPTPSMPPPPPPLPPSPVFVPATLQTVVSLPSLTNRQSTSKLHNCENLDKGKPMITLEELQKVKLRQVSVAANVDHHLNVSELNRPGLSGDLNE